MDKLERTAAAQDECFEWRNKLNAERAAHDDLKRSILDGSHPNLVLERKEREADKIRLKEVIEVCKAINQEKNTFFNQSCINLTRAETAERRIAAIRKLFEGHPAWQDKIEEILK